MKNGTPRRDAPQAREGSVVAIGCLGAIAGLVTAALVVMRLCGVIGWPWALVLAPLWVPGALCLGVLLAMLAALPWSR